MPAVDLDNLEVEELESAPDTLPGEIDEPFDPRRIEVVTKGMTVDLLLKRFRQDELTLQPDFQRSAVWNRSAQSRLIESMLVRLPLPLFYFDASDDDNWLTVDGLQRLTAIKEFVIDKVYVLQNLEFLSDFEGMSFDELPRAFQRRIEETELQVSLIQAGTPDGLKFNLFKRINTGGMPLSPQEIRHALNQGPATKLLEELATSDAFLQATTGGVAPLRMGDRELALRFLAFYRVGAKGYSTKDLDLFLHNEMQDLNQTDPGEFVSLREHFYESMSLAHDVLGRHAFRKVFSVDQESRSPINKALFDAWSVGFARLTKKQRATARQRSTEVFQGYVDLLANDLEFLSAVSQGTGQPAKVALRLNRVQEFLVRVVK
ncbi:hypothetical protein ASC61_12510 [Aeromicrobium sp. Root344]|uniref:DUF262 domain-containing protein n=1 Tax=Aeromicrobium sp. Root344 TaxID=1736521 RepID=UPI0006FB68EE|nr:DUF262 domain-containing protein [Aeromicrobium sp. Root344]KQV75762.1 hypothetical protein ASC61_12510 [Aeromicrobium sp. Root344]